MGLWIRETFTEIKTRRYRTTKKSMNSITSNQGVYTPTNNQNDSWTMEIRKKKNH